MSAGRTATLVAIVVLAAACTGTTAPSRTAPSDATVSPAATGHALPSSLPPSPSPRASASAFADPSPTPLGTPPVARLAVDGGDPVEGQLGTYTWAGGGSDAPWLPGAPIDAAAGEPMTVVFEPVVDVAAWRARIVPAAATGPAGARVVGEGSGEPRFDAPGAGAWTLEIQVTFAAGMGAASYAWALSVS